MFCIYSSSIKRFIDFLLLVYELYLLYIYMYYFSNLLYLSWFVY